MEDPPVGDLHIPATRSFEPPRSFLRKPRLPLKSRSFGATTKAANGETSRFSFKFTRKNSALKGISTNSSKTSSSRRSFKLSKPRLFKRSRSLSVQASNDSSCDPKDRKQQQQTISLSPLRLKKSSVPGANFLRRISFVRNSSKESKNSAGTLLESDDDIAKPQYRVVVSPISDEPNTVADGKNSAFNCATAILGHSYLEMCGPPELCGCRDLSFSDLVAPCLPEDPTVQESVECIFASQLQDGLGLWDDEDDIVESKTTELQSPALLHQSRLNRTNRGPSVLSRSTKRYQQANLLYLGTFDPTLGSSSIKAEEEKKQWEESPLMCHCARSNLPALHPRDWPQAPLLLRPTPGSGTRIKGVRYAKETEHLWEPGSKVEWPDALATKWGEACHTPSYGCCEKCSVLPINNGNEASGESLVIDFETEEFEGSFLLRLRFSEGTTPEPYDDTKGYFKGMNRRYQAVVRGRFKKRIPFIDLATGFKNKRPCGKLPPKWILRGGIKVLSFFAPQLDAKFEGDRPHSLSPLGSTPQSILVEDEESDILDGFREEPRNASKTLLGESSLAESSLQRGKFRKKNFDKRFVQGSLEPMTDPSKMYTFEFLQHLFNFQDFSIELGSMLGSVHLEEILDGQPLQVMATHGDNPLWSFDIWHECLWDKAILREKEAGLI